MKIICLVLVSLLYLSAIRPPETFSILIVRSKKLIIQDKAKNETTPRDYGLIVGTLYVNQKPIGITYENVEKQVKAGVYNGLLRYASQKGFVQGPLGQLATIGDFLLEIQNAKGEAGQSKTNVLFHGGIKPHQSEGCIMLGPVDKSRLLADDSALRQLRLLFYGTEFPNSTPNKSITIEISSLPNNAPVVRE